MNASFEKSSETEAPSELSEKLLPSSEVVQVDEGFLPQDELLQQISWTKGEVQPPVCQDGVWVIMFLLQLTIITALAMAWGVPHFQTGHDGEHNLYDSDPPIQNNIAGLYLLTASSAVSAMLVAGLVLALLIHYADVLVQASILFNLLLSLVVVIVCATQQATIGALLGMLSFAIGACYAWVVWDRLPWAASNLVTACTAINTNAGVFGVGLLLSAMSLVYSLVWILALVGTVNHLTTCEMNDQDEEVCTSHVNGFVIALFLLSLYWTMQVIQNILHVVVAGVVGTWWFAPSEARSCCSPTVMDSFMRASTTSLGSICCGSLLVALLQVLHQILARERRNGSILACIVDCLVRMLQKMLEYFNKWSFVYVGLYGYPYFEAGPKVMKLFRDRGWSTIINDQLVQRVLQWMALVMGALTGLMTVGIIKIWPSLLSHWISDSNSQAWIAFGLGMVMGAMVSNILLRIVASAVDTVIVCFAEAPVEFRHAYPELSIAMEDAWQQTFRSEYVVVIIDSNLV